MESLSELKNTIMQPVVEELMRDVLIPSEVKKKVVRKEDFEDLNSEQVKIILIYKKWWILKEESIAKKLNISKSNLNYHLKVLKEKGWLENLKDEEGFPIKYKIHQNIYFLPINFTDKTKSVIGAQDIKGGRGSGRELAWQEMVIAYNYFLQNLKPVIEHYDEKNNKFFDVAIFDKNKNPLYNAEIENNNNYKHAISNVCSSLRYFPKVITIVREKHIMDGILQEANRILGDEIIKNRWEVKFFKDYFNNV
jgi:DNA-binding transcriptional ArsR family regulator